MIEIHRITDWDKASAYQDAWNNLINNQSNSHEILQAASEEPANTVHTIYQTFEWNKTWWQSFGDANHHELLLLFAFERELLIGIAPLMIQKRNFLLSSKVIYFIGASNSNWSSDFCSFIIKDKHEQVISAFLHWLNLHPQYWEELELNNIPENSMDICLLRKEFKGRSALRFIQDAPSRLISETDEISQLIQLFSSHSSKQQLTKLNKKGILTYHFWDRAQDINPKLEGFFQQHIERRSKTPFPSFLQNKNYKNYFRSLINILSPKGWVKFLQISSMTK